MRKLLFVFCIIFLAFSVFGTEITAPAQLPSGAGWSFSVALEPSNSFTKTVVTIDGVEIVSAFANSQAIVDPFNGEKVIKAFVADTDPNSNAGMVLFVSHIGLNAGTHSIKATAFNNDAVVNTAEKTTVVVDVLSTAFEEQVKQKISDAVGAVETNTHNKIAGTMEQLRKEIIEANEKNKEEISSLKNSLNSSIEKTEAVLAENRTLKQQAAQLQQTVTPTAVASTTEQQTGFPIIGLAELSGNLISNFGFTILLVLVALVVIALAVKKIGFREREISLPDFETAYESISVPKDVSEENIDEILRMTSKGKWAYGKEEK